MSAEENKAIARRVYEIFSIGDFEGADQIVDPDAPDNECQPGMERPQLLATFEQFATEVVAPSPTCTSPSRI